MRVRLVLFACLLAATTHANASWELGIESASPVGDFGDVAGGGGGIFFELHQQFDTHTLGTLHLGAISYGGIDLTSGFTTVEVRWFGYPMTVGGLYYLNGVENHGLFIKGSAGVLYKRGTVESLGVELDESDTGFVASPGIGWDFGKGNVTAVYNIGDDDWTWFGISVAYRGGN